MAISHKKNGFITTILNQSKKDDIVLLKGSPVIETKVVIPPTKQSPQFYKAEPLKKDNLINRLLKLLGDISKERNSNNLAKAIGRELSVNNYGQISKNRSGVKIREDEVTILKSILDELSKEDMGSDHIKELKKAILDIDSLSKKDLISLVGAIKDLQDAKNSSTHKENFTTRSRYKKDIQVKEQQVSVLQDILEKLTIIEDIKPPKEKSSSKSSKIGSFFTKKLKFIKKLFKKLFLPFTILSALIGGTNWEKFKEVAKNFLNFLQPLFDFLGNIGKNALDAVAKFFEKYPTIVEAAKGLLEGMGKVYTYITEKLKALGVWLSSMWSEYVMPSISNLPTILFNGLTKVYAFIIEKLKALGAWLGSLWDSYVSPNIDKVADILTSGLNKVYHYIADKLKALGTWLVGLWDEYAPPSVKGVATSLLEGLNKVYEYLSSKLNELGKWVGGLWDEYVSPALPTMPDMSRFSELTDDLSNKVKLLHDKVKNFFSGITNSISNAIDKLNPFHETKEEKKIKKLKKKLNKIKELEEDIEETKERIETVKNGNKFTNIFRKSEKELTDTLSRQQKELSELNLKAYRDSVKSVKEVAIVGSEEIRRQVVKNIETTVNNNSPKDEVKMDITNTANLKELQDALKVATSKDGKKSLTRKIKVTQQYYDDLAKIETGNLKDKYNVVNKYGYVGKYQYGKSTAMPFLKKLGKKWSDFKGNKELQEKVVRMDTESRIPRILKLKKKFGLEETVTPNDLWISHNMGMKGYKEIVLQPHLAPTKARVRNMSANVNSRIKKEGVTKESYIRYWENKFNESGVKNESEIVSHLKQLIEAVKNSPNGNVEVKDPTVLEFINDTKDQGAI